MKKIIITLLLCLTVGASLFAQRLEENKFTYADGVEFTVKALQNYKTASYGNGDGYTYIAKKGTTFKTGYFEFSNTTGSDVEIDFEKFFLIDNNGNRYNANGVVQAYKVTSTVEKYQQKLKAGKTKIFLCGFWPAFPKNMEVTKMEVNGSIIELKAKSKK